MRNTLICDFDETITIKDTIGTLAKLPYLIKSNMKPEWKHFEDKYMAGYGQLHSFYLDKRKLPLLSTLNTLKITREKFHTMFNQEIEYQKSYRNIELNSINEIEKYKVFSNITLEDVRSYVRTINNDTDHLIREGFLECLANHNITKDDLYIISINWSREFIQYNIPSKYIENTNIYCNNLIIENNIYNGDFSKGLLTGSDKLDCLSKLLDREISKDSRIWYIGDSSTDLLPILYTSVNGILLINPKENEKKFLDIITTIFGQVFDEITDYVKDDNIGIRKLIEKENGTAFYIAKTWYDIDKLLN